MCRTTADEILKIQVALFVLGLFWACPRPAGEQARRGQRGDYFPLPRNRPARNSRAGLVGDMTVGQSGQLRRAAADRIKGARPVRASGQIRLRLHARPAPRSHPATSKVHATFLWFRDSVFVVKVPAQTGNMDQDL